MMGLLNYRIGMIPDLSAILGTREIEAWGRPLLRSYRLMLPELLTKKQVV